MVFVAEQIADGSNISPWYFRMFRPHFRRNFPACLRDDLDCSLNASLQQPVSLILFENLARYSVLDLCDRG